MTTWGLVSLFSLFKRYKQRIFSAGHLAARSVHGNLNLCMETSISALQPQSVQSNLNMCKATSICAKQPQSVQSNLNSCKAASIRALQLNPKSKGLFQGAKMIYRT